MAHGTYRIKLVKYCKRNEVIAEYAAPMHPVKGEVVWHRDKKYIVAQTSHILSTLDAGNSQECHRLDFVEVEVML